MSALVNNLLDMARIQSGEVKLRREWQPIEEVIGSALKAAQPALVRHRVDVDVPAELPLVEFDAALIERVLFNLFENAAKYTPEATPIHVSAAVSGNELVVSVVDHGPGVQPAQRDAVFEKFTRGVRESATPGVGLGLAISRAIIEAHHGRIWVDDAPDGGARFSFTLPLGTPPEVPSTEESDAGKVELRQ